MERLAGFLTESQRVALRGVLHRAGRSAVEHGRAHALLLLDQGRSLPGVAEIMFLDPPTIRNGFERFRDGQEDGLFQDKQGGRKPGLHEEQRRPLAPRLDPPLHATTRAVIEGVHFACGVTDSVRGMNARLHDMGFVYPKPKPVPGKADPVAPARLVRLFRERMANPAPPPPVFFTEAVHPTPNATPAHGWLRKGRAIERPAHSCRDRLNLQGALNAEPNEVVVARSAMVKAEAVIGMRSRLKAVYPDTGRFVLMADPAAYDHARPVQAYIQASGGEFGFMYGPPYSPNLNIIGRLGKFRRSRVMNHRYYRTLP